MVNKLDFKCEGHWFESWFLVLCCFTATSLDAVPFYSFPPPWNWKRRDPGIWHYPRCIMGTTEPFAKLNKTLGYLCDGLASHSGRGEGGGVALIPVNALCCGNCQRGDFTYAPPKLPCYAYINCFESSGNNAPSSSFFSSFFRLAPNFFCFFLCLKNKMK